jgi:hypothetical protein
VHAHRFEEPEEEVGVMEEKEMDVDTGRLCRVTCAKFWGNGPYPALAQPFSLLALSEDQAHTLSDTAKLSDTSTIRVSMFLHRGTAL